MLKSLLVSLSILFQETSVPILGPLRSLLSIALFFNTFYFLVISLIIALFGFFLEVYSLNFYISLISLVTPFILMGGNYKNLDLTLLIGTLITVSFITVLIQLFLPSLSNNLFIPFTEASYLYDGITTRATILSREPSFAAEMIFPVFLLLVYFYKDVKLNQVWLVMIMLIVFSVRASTFIQQAYIFITSYSFFMIFKNFNRVGYFYNVLIYLFYILFMVFFFVLGYQLLIGIENDSNFLNDSLDVYGSWRTISNISSLYSAEIISFFSSLDFSGWEDKILDGGSHAYTGSQSISWIVQPFSLFAVYLLDFGLLGFLIIFLAIFFVIYKKTKFNFQTNLQKSILFSLLTNSLFFSPKWQLLGFLMIGLIVSNLKHRRGN